MSGAKQPKIIRRKIGGADVLLMPTPGTGLASMRVVTRRGSVDEPADRRGVASFAAGMLKRGTTRRGSRQIAFDLENIGASASHSGGIDSATSSVRAASADFEDATEIFFECLREPAFDADEFEISRKAVIANLMRVEDDSFELTYRKYLKRRFAGHGYAHPSEGEIEDVQALSPEGCRAWHARTVRPENMLVAVGGDVDPDGVCAMLEKRFADWPEAPNTEPTTRSDARTAGLGETGLEENEKDDIEQGFIVVGYAAPEFSHPDRVALRVASAALGEGFSGRLFTILRDERSLAYAVGSFVASHRLGGHTALYIGTQPDRLDEAREGLVEQAEWIRNNTLSDDDLSRAKNYAAGKYAMSHQSIGSRLDFLTRWEDLGGGAEEDFGYVDRIKSVTARQIREAAEKWWVDPTVTVLKPKAKSGAGV